MLHRLKHESNTRGQSSVMGCVSGAFYIMEQVALQFNGEFAYCMNFFAGILSSRVHSRSKINFDS